MNPRYVVKGKIGAGGLGEVYLATDTQLDRDVALKRVKPPESGTADALHTDLIREARTLSSLQHPHIVTIYDVGQDEHGPFVVMELLKGETLDDVIARGAMTVEDFREVVIQTLEGMIAAQEMGLVHRDLKPGNLMVIWLASGKFQIKILDFGLAKFSRTATRQTEDQESAIMGSIFFMAPEQFERLPLDARTDMYSLGCIFYQILTTKYPFDGKTGPEVMVSHLQHQVVNLFDARQDLPVWMADWVMWLISRDMEERPAEARTALDYFRNQKTGIRNPTSTTPTSKTGVKLLGRGAGPGGVQGAAGKKTQQVSAKATQRVGGSTTQPTTAAARSSRTTAKKVPAKKSSAPLWISLAALATAGGGAIWWFTRPAQPVEDPRAALEAVLKAPAPSPDSATLNLLMTALRSNNGDTPRAAAALKKLTGPGAPAALAAELEKSTGPTRLILIDLVAAQRSKAGLAQLLKIAASESGATRAAALAALPKVAAPSDLPQFFQTLPKIKDPAARTALAQVAQSILAKEGDGRAQVRYLTDALSQSNSTVRPDLLRLIGATGHNDAQIALAAEINAGGERRLDALGALKSWPNATDGIADALLAAAVNSPGDREELIAGFCQALNRNAVRNGAELTALLRKARPLITSTRNREALCQALACTAAPEALQFARELAADPAWAVPAGKALTQLTPLTPNIIVLTQGENRLDAAKAVILSPEKEAYYTSTSRYLTGWKNSSTSVAWDISVPAGPTTVSVDIVQSTSLQVPRSFRIRLGLNSVTTPVKPTDSNEAFATVSAGTFQVPRPGVWRLWLEPFLMEPGQSLFNVREAVVSLK